MKIAIASQNQKEVTGHGGRCRRFWVYDIADGKVRGRELLELAKEQAFHAHDVTLPHPMDGVQALITGGMGGTVAQKLRNRGIEPIVTTVTDLDEAIEGWLTGSLRPQGPQEHDPHHGHEHGH